MSEGKVGYGNPPESGKFKPGDKRINRAGRPKGFDELRALAQLIATEVTGEGQTRKTLIDALLRKWATSKDPRLQQAFVEYAYGKVPQRAELTGRDGKSIIVKIIKGISYDDL